MYSFEQIKLQFKAKNRRLAGGKSRFFNAEMQLEMPKMNIQDFGNRLWSNSALYTPYPCASSSSYSMTSFQGFSN